MTVDRQVVAVDVGGTGIKAALVGRDLTATHAVRVPTRRIDGSVDVTQIAELVGLLAEKAAGGVGGVGVAVPGIVDDATGVVVTAVNLGWANLDLRSQLAERTGLPLLVRHDVRAGGLAEFTVGAAAGAANALFVPIGTGIAAAARIDGHLLSAGGYLGEIGHVVVDTDGALCTCGQRGCLETIAAAPAVARRYRDRGGESVRDAAEVVERVALGDPIAIAVWDEACGALADALVTAVTLFGSELVVIGGGLAEAGDTLVRPVRSLLLRRLTFHRRPRVVRASLGQDAGRVGAAILGWEAADG